MLEVALKNLESLCGFRLKKICVIKPGLIARVEQAHIGQKLAKAFYSFLLLGCLEQHFCINPT